jgi:hypothetical protein
MKFDFVKYFHFLTNSHKSDFLVEMKTILFITILIIVNSILIKAPPRDGTVLEVSTSKGLNVRA